MPGLNTPMVTCISGKWNVPKINGERPPPSADFTLDVLPNDRSKAILFGGRIVPERNKSHRKNMGSKRVQKLPVFRTVFCKYR